METAAKSADKSAEVLRGQTTARTPVLRVGKLREGQPLCARLILDGRPVDVAIHDGQGPAFFDIAKAGRMANVGLLATWVRTDDGRWRFNQRKTVAIHVEAAEDGITGQEFIDRVTSERALLTSKQLDSLLEELEGQ